MTTKDGEDNAIYIGPGVIFQGTIEAPGKATIDGQVVGLISAQEIVVGETGHIEGVCNANQIEIHGFVTENIHCSEYLIFHPTAKVTGTVVYKEISFMKGANFSGFLEKDESVKIDW